MIRSRMSRLGSVNHHLIGPGRAPGSYWSLLSVRCRCHACLASAENRIEAVFELEEGDRRPPPLHPPGRETARGPVPEIGGREARRIPALCEPRKRYAQPSFGHNLQIARYPARPSEDGSGRFSLIDLKLPLIFLHKFSLLPSTGRGPAETDGNIRGCLTGHHRSCSGCVPCVWNYDETLVEKATT